MKKKVTYVIAILCYYLGIDNLFYFLNRKAKRIVTFHNVMPADVLPDGKKIGLTDTEDTFAMKIREMKKHFTFSTDVQDVSTLTITFDDGYRNEYEIAKKLLGDDVKGLIFVSGQLINNNDPAKALIIDVIMHWTELVPNGIYIVDYPALVQKKFSVTDDNRQWLWQKVIWPSFVLDHNRKGHGLLDALDKAYPMKRIFAKCSPEYLRLRLTGFTSDELNDIRKDGWLMGWHTQNHFPLSALSIEQKKQEIAGDAPEEMKQEVLSYPYGELQSVDGDCLKIAEEAGFPCAVSNLPYSNTMSGNFFLPRFMLSNNKYLLHLELSGVKFFLQNNKLLPKSA